MEEIRTILVVGMDTVKQKNLHQFVGMGKYGYRFIVLTTDSLGYSKEISSKIDVVELFKVNSRRRIISLFTKLVWILIKKQITIIEIYPDSSDQLLVALLAKLIGKPTVVVARGREEYYMNGVMPQRTRLAFWGIYWLGEHVIYKEPFIAQFLRDMRKTRLYLLVNSTVVPQHSHFHSEEKCTILYLNRMESSRNPQFLLTAFLEICEALQLSSSSRIRLKMVGFMGERCGADIYQNELLLYSMVADRDVPVEMHPWTQHPEEWLSEADIFVMPANRVFLNHSLLEAMARGVVPIINDAEWSDKIVTHGIEGYVAPLKDECWRDAMRKLILDPELRRSMGAAARKKVEREFSLESYVNKYRRIYDEILTGHPAVIK